MSQSWARIAVWLSNSLPTPADDIRHSRLPLAFVIAFSSQALTTSYYHGAQGFILAYDVTDRTSYDNIPEWLSIIEHHASEEDFQRILVANKCRCNERNRVITKKEGAKFAQECGMRYAEINDLQSSEIDGVLKLLIQDILSNAGSHEKMEETVVCEDFGAGEQGIKIKQDKELLLG